MRLAIGLATLFFTIPSVVRADEVIEIHERLAPAVRPKPEHYNPRKTPPYSDDAILTDSWTRAWLLLDVDDHGTVTRFKFLKHPGHDLDKIATSEAWKLHFTPGLDIDRKPVATFIVWRIEWPSYWWLVEFNQATALPFASEGIPPVSPVDHVPCAGSGPLDLSSVHPVYRDCSQPDLGQAAKEHWVTRGKDAVPITGTVR